MRQGSVLDAFMDSARDVATADALQRIRSIRPTSEVKREEIEELRRWAREHMAIDAVRADTTSGQRLIEF
jgi:hypothetical protein